MGNKHGAHLNEVWHDVIIGVEQHQYISVKIGQVEWRKLSNVESKNGAHLNED